MTAANPSSSSAPTPVGSTYLYPACLAVHVTPSGQCRKRGSCWCREDVLTGVNGCLRGQIASGPEDESWREIQLEPRPNPASHANFRQAGASAAGVGAGVTAARRDLVGRQRGSDEARQASGPARCGRRMAPDGWPQRGRRRGAGDSAPARRAETTATRAASSSGVGSPLTTRRTGSATGASTSRGSSPPECRFSGPVESVITGCSRASWAAGSRAWCAAAGATGRPRAGSRAAR